MFSEVHHATTYSINIYGKGKSTPRFINLANLFLPKTIDACFLHDGKGEVPGLKEEVATNKGIVKSSWNIKGHKDRIINITENELSLFSEIYDESGTSALEARLPALHAYQLLEVLKKFAKHPKRLGDLQGSCFSTQHWNESTAQVDGTILRETIFPDSNGKWIMSGPHFFVGNPLYKSPREECKLSSDYSTVDLLTIPDEYLPRTNYVPACTEDEYRARTPKVSWVDTGNTASLPVIEYYRVLNREMIGPSSERTLITAIIPKK
nr:hypothetical protein [Psychrobacter sp. PraFG1]UNK04540.1 hypothetical protein MN210_09640 [Psychrobacter sp. PraFG1]